jgi:RND family efflux transporter MFP subunit
MKHILAFLTVSLVCTEFSCMQPPAPTQPPTPVNMITVKKQPVVYYDRFTATTAALNQVNLLPQVQGYVTGIFFKEGAHVRKGQLLYEIDKRTYQANYNNLEAALKVAQGNLAQAQQDADRYTFLHDNNAVAKQQYDHALITLQNAQNSVHSAEAALNGAKLNLVYSAIYAPFDGTIGFSNVKLGDMVVVGQTVLNTVSSDDPMGVDFPANEKELPYFEEIQAGKWEAFDSLFSLLLPDGSVYPQTGKISVIDRAVNSQTGTVRIRLVFPNPKNVLRSGMSCVLKVHNKETEPQVVIPNKAVVEQMGEFFVYMSRDTVIAGKADFSGNTKFGVAMQKKVKLGSAIGPNIIVKSGLVEGDRIILDGLQSLHDGSVIAISNRKPAADTTSAKGDKQPKQP